MDANANRKERDEMKEKKQNGIECQKKRTNEGEFDKEIDDVRGDIKERRTVKRSPPPFQCPQGRLINSKSKPRVEDEAEKKGKRRSVEEEEEEEDDDDEDPAAARRLIGRYLILLAIYLDRES